MLSIFAMHCFLKNKVREKKMSEGHNAGIAFAEVVIYIEEVCIDTEAAPIYKLADLVNLYSTRLKQLGVNMESRVHST